DEAHRSIFSGDTFGISYRALDTERGAFITPTTPPSQFDPDQHIASIDRMLGYRPESMYLMHFSRVTGVARLGELLKMQVRELARIAQAHAHDADPAAGIRAEMRSLWLDLVHRHGSPLSDAEIEAVLENDLTLNTQGLLVWLERLVGGIDLAGVVESSKDARYRPGEAVLVTGCGLSETHDGGYAQFARVPGDWVIPMPAGLDAETAMALGTAGFTAALAIHRMEQNGQSPEGGPIAVTGASGGVGSLAVDMLAARGYRVVAVTGKAAAAGYLKALGAAEVLARQETGLGSRPLETARFGGAIDNVGGDVLTWLTRTVDF